MSLICKALEVKKYCNMVFLDVPQTFEKVGHVELLYKVKNLRNRNYYLLVKSHLKDKVKHTDAFSGYYLIKSGVPQSCVLGPFIYYLPETDTIKMFSELYKK